jgi:hypothetical protein
MAAQHNVWIKFNDNVDRNRVDASLAALNALEEKVPGVVQLTLGGNFTDRALGSTHGLVVTLADRYALDSYAAHPYYVEVAQSLAADASLLALDFEF